MSSRKFKKVSDAVADRRSDAYMAYRMGQYKARPKRMRVRKASRFSGPKAEVKFLDTALAFTIDATAEVPATGQLCIIPQNDTQSGREGRKCVASSLLIKGTAFFVPAAAATATEAVWIYVVQDTQANGAAAVVANDDTGIFTAAGANLAVAVRCLANTDRFKILRKIQLNFHPGAGATTAYNNVLLTFEEYIKLNIPLEYDASVATGALTSIRSNNIFLVAGGGQATDDTITIAGVARLRFVG